jgi:hypothetical protein
VGQFRRERENSPTLRKSSVEWATSLLQNEIGWDRKQIF